MAQTDVELMLRVKAGDAASFAALLARYRAPVIHYLSRMVRDQASAEELAQEVFLRVYKARGRYSPDARFTTWLFKIATNLALNAVRDSRLERGGGMPIEEMDTGSLGVVRDPHRNMEQEMIEQERVCRIREAVWALPEKQRAAVILHKYHEMDYVQIARILGCSTSALRSLLFRAYESLRERLRPLVEVREKP